MDGLLQELIEVMGETAARDAMALWGDEVAELLRDLDDGSTEVQEALHRYEVRRTEHLQLLREYVECHKWLAGRRKS